MGMRWFGKIIFVSLVSTPSFFDEQAVAAEPSATPCLSALDAANRYYNDVKTALAYFHKIRGIRGVMPDLVEWEKNFPVGARILEVGFGPGIEFEFLLSVGKDYKVDGVDISHPQKIQLERLLDEKLGYGWRRQAQLYPYALQEFNPGIQTYDRIWASATFLHIDRTEVAPMILKYARALRPSGEFFLNFKVGDGPTRTDNEGRPFTYFTEKSFRSEILPQLPDLEIKQITTAGQGTDKLGRKDTQWLNITLVPKEISPKIP